MRIIIAGGRKFDDYDLLKTKMDRLTRKLTKPITIISGGARGADKLGDRWAFENGYKKEVYLPDYNKYGRYAPIKRNEEMVNADSDVLVAFHDGMSSGTQYIINYAKEKGIKVIVVLYKENENECGILSKI